MVTTNSIARLNPAAARAVELADRAIQLRAEGQRDAAVEAAQEAVVLMRGLLRFNRNTALPLLAQFLNLFSVVLSEAGRSAEALQAIQEAVDLRRELAATNRGAFLPNLAMSLNNLGAMLANAGRRADALEPAGEASDLYRELAAVNRRAFLPGLAGSLSNLGRRLSEVGRIAEALRAGQEAVDLYRELAVGDRGAFLPDLVKCLNNLGVRLLEVGRHAEALQVAQDAVESCRELAASGQMAILPDLAMSLNNLAARLGKAGRHAEALEAAQEALNLYRELAAAHRPAFLPNLAPTLINLGRRLWNVGRREEALQATQEALNLFRELATTNREAFVDEVASALNDLGERLSGVGRHAEALQAVREAVDMYRELAAGNGVVFLVGLASSLNNLCGILTEAGRYTEALRPAQEASDLFRELAAARRVAVLPALASSLNNLGGILSAAGRNSEALEVAREAVNLLGELAAGDREGFLPDLARGLNNLGYCLSGAGRRSEALEAFRDSCDLLFELPPTDPNLWTQLARRPMLMLDAAQDLRRFHLRMLALLTEHRELAWNSEHGQVFLDLQAQVALRVWGLLATLPAEEGHLLDEAVAAMVATLQSPDLARWLEARGAGDGPLAKLAELKREVIESEQLLAALRKGLPGGGDAGWRAISSGAGAEGQRDALMKDIDHQSAKAQALRQAFREERARLVDVDPRFAAAFEPVGAQTLRSIAGHARGGALLCVLELGSAGTAGQHEPSYSERSRCVAALLHADGHRTQLLELTGVHEVAWHAQNFRPEALGLSRRGPMRGAPAGTTRPASDGVSPPPITDLIAPRLSQSFWLPLHQSLQASGVAIERLHVCLHGTAQQLPLALRQAGDCPGLQVVAWPGLPYLRRAAMATSAKGQSGTGTDASAPWLVGHDCAWGSEQPLPMVAFEAALLRDLLHRHGQPVQQIRLAAQLHGRASALVACCHGGAEQAQFNHALHLGQEPLTVRQILQENLGPPLALLPACHAGRTDEDAAGNALGVAAAFMLSGTKVVAASSKAVPDLLQPWLSTLKVWHAMQGLPHHEAATLAREQFARLDFPAGYRSWLQQALLQALATIQPGGEEDEHIRGVHAQTALEQVEEHWPWEGETQDLFSADRTRREEATRSVVQGILRPRGGEAGARALAAEAREMAAFVFVYGVDSTSGCVRNEPDQDAGRAAAERII